MKFSDALKKYSASDVQPFELERFATALDKLGAMEASRFSVGAIARETSFDREVSRRLLSLAVEAGILKPIYEVECPTCGSLVKAFEDESFRMEDHLECEQPSCQRQFTPDAAEVRVLFDFTAEYVQEGSYPSG